MQLLQVAMSNLAAHLCRSGASLADAGVRKLGHGSCAHVNDDRSAVSLQLQFVARPSLFQQPGAPCVLIMYIFVVLAVHRYDPHYSAAEVQHNGSARSATCLAAAYWYVVTTRDGIPNVVVVLARSQSCEMLLLPLFAA